DFQIVALDEHGKESTTLRAPLLERQRGDQTINIATPLFEMPDKDGKHWTLRAETGWLSAKGDEMKLRGNVAGDSPVGPGTVPTTFRTDHLDVFPKENRARTDALVTMTRPGMEQ
ncbi:LPS export ABC transporter periplasmic protein LptC, partial [Klebsiella pneumoniae]